MDLRALTRALVAMVTLGSALVAVGPSAGAVENEEAASSPRAERVQNEAELAVGRLLPNPRQLHPDVLAQVRLDLGPVGRLGDQLIDARVALDDALVRHRIASGRSQRLDIRQGYLGERLASALVDEREAGRLLDDAESDLATFAISTFVGFEDLALADFRADVDSQAVRALADESQRVIHQAAIDARADHDVAVAVSGELRLDRNATLDQLVTTQADLARAESDRDSAQETIDRLGPSFERSLLGLVVPGTDIPVVVLDAYYRAERQFAVEVPSCKVTWAHLAGIGRAESRHGAFGGNVVGGDGRTSGEILGPQLNGDPWLAIPDSDGGALDLDTVWDRAVGPMQFIPTSWAIFGRDGNDDGVKDPHNIYDAAQAAADHLCRGHRGLDQRGNFQAALLGYNRSVAYGIEVMAHSTRYQAAIGLVGPSGSPDLTPITVIGERAAPPPTTTTMPDDTIPESTVPSTGPTTTLPATESTTTGSTATTSTTTTTSTVDPSVTEPPIETDLPSAGGATSSMPSDDVGSP